MAAFDLSPVLPGREEAATIGKAATAWELECHLLDAIHMLEDAGSLDGGPPEYVQELVFQAMENAVEKRDALAGAFLRYQKGIEALEVRIADARAKIEQKERAVAYLRNYILSILDLKNEKSIAGAQYKISWQRNPARVELDTDFGTHKDDEMFMRTIPEKKEPNKQMIAKALKEDGTVRGARLVDGERRVVIK
jgi:hypothetical protein